VLIDDTGFGASSVFGGPVNTPTFERLAAGGGTVTLYLDGKPVGQGRVDGTQPMIFSGETTDVGSDTATPVSDDYGPKDSTFTGRIRWVQIDLGKDAEDADHLITPEERLRVAMARQ
jgi:arylsulfatase